MGAVFLVPRPRQHNSSFTMGVDTDTHRWKENRQLSRQRPTFPIYYRQRRSHCGMGRRCCNTFVPSRNDFSFADSKLERLASVARAVDFLSICECQYIMTLNTLTSSREGGIVPCLKSFNIDAHCPH